MGNTHPLQCLNNMIWGEGHKKGRKYGGDRSRRVETVSFVVDLAAAWKYGTLWFDGNKKGIWTGRESVARRPFVGKRLGFAAAASVTDHQDGIIGLRWKHGYVAGNCKNDKYIKHQWEKIFLLSFPTKVWCFILVRVGNSCKAVERSIFRSARTS